MVSALSFLPTEVTLAGSAEPDALNAQIDAGAIVTDPKRQRPYWFDGRFLAAADLTADQDYHRARQSDLAQAIGAGVIRGLTVRLGRAAASNAPTLIVDPGLGLTPSGDIVQLGQTLELTLAQLAQHTALDLAVGIKQLAGATQLSGLYVLALRPVEFASNPVASYPTTLDGERTVRDGDIVEGTLVTLIPYADAAGVASAAARRARLARQVFVDRQGAGVLQDALPLAMLCLDGGVLQWLDMFLVRREVGAESTLAAGLGQRPRALVEAWFQQHLDALDDIDDASLRNGFPAASRFEVLPPVGPLPAACLSFGTVLGGTALLQGYFPPQVDCEFAFIPSDEMAALVQEALALPPIDLQAGDAALDRLAVLILAPITRQRLEALKRELASVSRPVLAAAAGLVAKRSPLEAMLRLSTPQTILQPTLPEPERVLAAWRRALDETRQQAAQAAGGRAMFWYLRRRQLPYASEVSGVTLRLAGDALDIENEVGRRLQVDGALEQIGTLRAGLPTLANAEVVNLLGAPRLAVSPNFDRSRFATSDLLRASVVQTLVQRAAPGGDSTTPRLDQAGVLAVARTFGDPRLGEGFDALGEAADADTRAALQAPDVAGAVAASGVAPDLDLAARTLGTVKLAAFAQQLVGAARASDAPAALARLAGKAST